MRGVRNLGSKLVPGDSLTSEASSVGCGLVLPPPLDLMDASAQVPGGMHAWPLERALDEAFLGSLSQQVVESCDLCLLFIGDLNRAVSSGEELLSPTVGCVRSFLQYSSSGTA